jgi:hypothetical protein
MNVQTLLQGAKGGPFVDDAGKALQEQLFTVDLGFGVAVAFAGDKPSVELIFVEVGELGEAPAGVIDPAADAGDHVLAVGLASADGQLIEVGDGFRSGQIDELRKS